MGPKLTDKQYHALTKRFADAAEKLSIGSVLYWIFQNQLVGVFVGIAFFLASLIITFIEAKE